VPLPDLRLWEQLGIVVSSLFYRTCSLTILFLTVSLHEPGRFLLHKIHVFN